MRGNDWIPLDLIPYDAMHPSGIGRAEFTMRKGLIDQFRARGIWQMVMAALFIPEILDRPTVTFQGLQRPELDRGFCYAGTPQNLTPQNCTVDVVKGETFVIFLTEGFRITEYGWEQEDPSHPGFPIGHDDPNRFGRKLWQLERN